jgi:hypothetical protein
MMQGGGGMDLSTEAVVKRGLEEAVDLQGMLEQIAEEGEADETDAAMATRVAHIQARGGGG